MNLDHELDVAKNLALEAGAALKRHRAGSLRVGHKARGEVVTAADVEADAIIRVGLQSAFPDDAIYSEETADSPARLSKERVWIVDPLDATSNYIADGDDYSVSICLSFDGRPVLGVVHNPARGELFAGYEGHGVTLNGTRVQVSHVTQLSGARVTVSRKEWQRGLDQLDGVPLIPIASMAYKLARVAAGLDDGVLSRAPRKEWGTCAGVALVLTAGGRATLLDGSEIAFNRRELRQRLGMVAAGPELHSILLGVLRDAPNACS